MSFKQEFQIKFYKLPQINFQNYPNPSKFLPKFHPKEIPNEKKIIK
jgi:hypothetical protein